jgi:peptidoglycan/xylan/chitin deacetylase (PgdA/CDA1 family)
MFRTPPYFLPFYHAVCDHEQPHLKHLYSIKTTAQFIEDLDFICHRYIPVTLDTFYQQAREGFNTNSKPIFHLTFDDGLSQCHDVIMPILEKKGIPATFFINPAFIDNQELFFRFKASLLIDGLRTTKKRVPTKSTILKAGYHQQELLHQWALELGVDFEMYLKTHQPYLTKTQLQTLLEKGFTIGGHSWDHPEYRFINHDSALQQTQKSMSWIEEYFHPPVKAFSFPFTDFQLKKTFFDTLSQQGVADITFGTAGMKSDSAPMNFQRVAMEAFSKGLTAYRWHFFKRNLRMLFGTNEIDR